MRKRRRGGDGCDGGLSERERRTLDTLEGKLAKVRAWLAEGEDKRGRSGKPVKSNLSDNDSAKMASSHAPGCSGALVYMDRVASSA